jgi:hypothetical protein
VVEPVGPEAGLLCELRAGQVLGGPVVAMGPGALRELPAPPADRVPELLDQPEAIAIDGKDQREIGALDAAVDEGRPVGALEDVLPYPRPRVPVDLSAARRPYEASLAERQLDGRSAR